MGLNFSSEGDGNYEGDLQNDESNRDVMVYDFVSLGTHEPSISVVDPS